MKKLGVSLAFILYVLAGLTACFAGTGPDWEGALELRVDSRQRARAFSNGMQPVLAFSDYFEFFERSLTGQRKRISEGPWGGNLGEFGPGRFILSGTDIASGTKFSLTFDQVNHSTIELIYQFTAPARHSHLQCNVTKLASDLFTGALLEAEPAHWRDSVAVPLIPRPMEKRILLSGKNRVRLRGAFMDLEIVDSSNACGLFVADGRNVPWDVRKSLIVGVIRGDLPAGAKIDLHFRVRKLPATGGKLAKMAPVAGAAVKPAQTGQFFSLPPKKERQAPGIFRLEHGDPIVAPANGAAAHWLAEELRTLTGTKPSVVPGLMGHLRGIVFKLAPTAGLPTEGFALEIAPEVIVISGGDELGLLYGAFALVSRLRQANGGCEWSCAQVRDWPDLPVRGICMELLKPPVRDVEMMKRYITAVARSRGNTLILLHSPLQIKAWRDGRDDGNWTPAQMAEIVEHARSLGMTVWGGLKSTFRPQDFPEMSIRSGSDLYDPLSVRAYTTLFGLYDQILKTYQPSTLLVAHDEIRGLKLYAAVSGRSPADLFTADIARIHGWLKKRGVSTALWGDMLLEHDTWEGRVGSANSSNPFYNSGATHKALSFLPRDLWVLDWHYQPKWDYPSLQHFRQLGFSTVGAAWHDPVAARQMAESVKRHKGQGVIATDWGFWHTLSPAATTLVAPLCGWSADCSVGDDGRDVEALAEILRAPVYRQQNSTQKPIPLTGSVNARLKAVAGEAGLFGQGPALDLAGLALGEHVLGGVRFEVTPAAVVAKVDAGDISSSEVTLFKGRALVDRVALLQTCLLEAPQSMVRLLGHYWITYDSGRVEAIDLLENLNLTDVRSTVGLRKNVWAFARSPEILVGALPAWRGTSTTGISLNLQTLVWENPWPADPILKIRLSAAGGPPHTRLVVVGMTFLHN